MLSQVSACAKNTPKSYLDTHKDYLKVRENSTCYICLIMFLALSVALYIYFLFSDGRLVKSAPEENMRLGESPQIFFMHQCIIQFFITNFSFSAEKVRCRYYSLKDLNKTHNSNLLDAPLLCKTPHLR